MTPVPVTLTTGAACILLNLWLGWRIGCVVTCNVTGIVLLSGPNDEPVMTMLSSITMTL